MNLYRVWRIFGRLKYHHVTSFVFLFFPILIPAPAEIPEQPHLGPGQNRVISALPKNPIPVSYYYELQQASLIIRNTSFEAIFFKIQ